MNRARPRRSAASFTFAFVALSFVALAGSRQTLAAARPVGPLPLLPSVSRVKIRVEKDSVVVTHVVALPRGEWKSGDIDLYVAHGAPGVPIAVDVRLHHVPDGALEADDADVGEAVTYDRAPRAPDSAHPLLGRSRMAGIIAHVRDDRFRAATADGMAELRVRSLHPLPAEDATHGREVRVRLGASNGAPLTLGRLQIAAADPKNEVVRAEARLCGPDAEARLLSIAVTPKPPPANPAEAPIAPVLSVRHATDDLCVTYWTRTP